MKKKQDCRRKVASRDEKAKPIPVEKMKKYVEALMNSSDRMGKSEHDLEVVVCFLRICFCSAEFLGQPEAAAMNVLCTLLLANIKKKEPSALDCFSEIVQKASIDFNRRLQDQKYHGLSLRVSRQIAQLKTMKPDEEFDDPTLWNDYIQFMGELSSRVEFPLTFKYHKGSLTRDPEVADFVTAVSIYCKAYSCFMLLLVAAKCKFKELGLVHKSNEVDRRVDCLKGEATEILSFLSEPKYLTFLGRLPCEGGKLLKILALNRRLADKHVVEVVRSSLGLKPMPDLMKVEIAAEKVSRQSVRLEVDRCLAPPSSQLNKVVSAVTGPGFWVQFVNNTSFPMKVVSKNPQESNRDLRVLFDVPARSSDSRGLSRLNWFAACGYFILYLKGDLSSNMEPPATDAIVVEFALSRRWADRFRSQFGKINIQDKNAAEFTAGQDTHDTMQYGDIPAPLFISKGDVHLIVKAEIVAPWFSPFVTWRFAVQSFDPLAIDG
ncbi:uncharacterized protein LOC114962582 isoform X3 [Acropora millepora]|uniref:uncharacterized protein LOC114962582 isoform X3 n=1 Tax=Acropora millepora TaxID=45264 RepID=UPI001CF3D86D|nr:uncharacterized protein LOC114962582 isoform X3 [Acropora millepora]